MKRTILSLITLLLMNIMPTHADTYSQLWKQAAAAQQSDHPQTQLEVLRQIVDKATKERAYGHLLKAQLMAMSVQTAVSPDSLQPAVKRLEALEQQARDRQPALAAVYQSVLGNLYKNNADLADDSQERSRQYYQQSMSRPETLAQATAAGYEPFIVDGDDSRIFHDDLLHVIGMEAGNWQALHDYYLKAGNRAAACICALRLVQQKREGAEMALRKSKYLQTVDSLLDTYKDLTEAGEVAIEHYTFMEQATDATAEEKMNYINYALNRWGSWPRMNILRNAQGHLTLPSFHVSIGDGVQIPHTPRKVLIMSIVNVQNLTMSVQRVNVNGDTRLNPSQAADYSKLKKLLVPGTLKTYSRRYIGQPNYKVNRDSMEIEGLPVGVYLVEFTTDNTQIRPERRLLHVSDLSVIHETLPGKKTRFVAVNATTGQPVPGAKIRLSKQTYHGTNVRTETLSCDKHGELVFDHSKWQPDLLYVYNDEDKAMEETRFQSWFSYYDNKESRDIIRLYTDRSIYRPGQTVHVAALLFNNKNHEHTKAVGGQVLTLSLRDANYKEVASQQVTTDEYGMGAADFTLPSSGLTGRFSVRCSAAHSNSSTAFSVEEYKRPTFQVEFEKVSEAYQNGDTVTVKGSAKSFAGVPVQGAKVALSVTRRPALWWWFRSSRDTEQLLLRDTLVTDQDGAFQLRLPMQLPEVWNEQQRRFYTFDIQADVTDVAGETRHGSTSLPLSDKPTILTSDLPDKSLASELKTVTFSYKNNAGEPVEAGLTFRIDGGRPQEARTNVATPLTAPLTVGEHTFTAICGTDTLEQKVVLFSLDDKKPVVKTDEWFYLSATEFPRNGEPVYLQVGSSDPDQHIVYTLIAGDRVLESGSIDQSDALHNRAFTYKEDYKDGILLSYAWMKNGRLHEFSSVISRPLPDKSLHLTWQTFRDRLTPGQQEEWTLKVERPDSIDPQKRYPATETQLMAVLYDKSLDLIRNHAWAFDPQIYLSQPATNWNSPRPGNLSVYGEQTFKALNERELDFSHFNGDVFPAVYLSFTFGRHPRMFKLESATDMAVSMEYNEVAMARDEAKVTASAIAPKYAKEAATAEEDGGEPTGSDNGQVRENLAETAFFYPDLCTDKDGNVSIRFTLPEAITTWRFMGLAHDKVMNYGLLDGETVAKKAVMVQPNVPRFIRQGDKGQVAARIFNTLESPVTGTARMELLDPETMKTVYQQAQRYELEPNGTASALFPIDMPSVLQSTDSPLLICRVTVSGKGYSDGEQHYLPVLPASEMVTNTLPFTQNGPGTKTLDLSKLFSGRGISQGKLTVEYTNNPAWLMIQALPTMANPNEKDAISLVTAYYANSIGNHLMHQTPAIKQVVSLWKQEQGNETSLMSQLQKNQELKSLVLSETPWVLDAEREADQKQLLSAYFDESALLYRLSGNLEKLKALQNGDGSFSWWPGMRGSTYMTATVTETLVRLNSMIGQQTETANLISKGLDFLAKEIHKEVTELQKLAKKGNDHLRPSDTAISYLYTRAMDSRTVGNTARADIDYLVTLLERQASVLSIYGKARSAVILARNGRTRKASEYLQSIKEYTVYTEEMGRYFDTRKALYSWFDYRIPSQTAAIEALKALTPTDTQTIEEMQRWLLQEKRTQAWNTPINCVNAVFAFLDGAADKLSTDNSRLTVLKVDGQPLDLPKATAGLGYVKTTLQGHAMRTLTAEKTTEGTSWGAAYAQFMQPSTAVEKAAAGMKVKREVIADGKTLHVGDRVMVRITIEADRDYDFVQLQDRRAACLEPATQLSGYHWGYYCTPGDNATNYYFDQLSKGKHVVETEYYIDRLGEYETGTCTVQCAYSPEFMGRDTAKKLNVK